MPPAARIPEICARFFTFCLLCVLALVLVAGCDDTPNTPRPAGHKPNDIVECDNLMTDDELVTAEDPYAIPVDSVVTDWIQQNNYPVRSLTEECYTDLQFLKPLIGDRTLVQLGESGHGVAEFSMAKVRLIKFLHEQMGFDVIAFESSIFECYLANYEPDTLSAMDMMYSSIFAVWHCHEVLPLFEYIKETQETDRPLVLAGFDVQISSWLSVRRRSAFFRDVVAHIDPVYARTVFSFDSTLVTEYGTRTYNEFRTWVLNNFIPYQSKYNSLAAFLQSNMDSLKTIYSHDPAAPMIVRQTALSMPYLLRHVIETPLAALTGVRTNLAMPVRDEGMALNLISLKNDIYPGKKIVTWGHNYHFRHDYDTMGEIVEDALRPELYTVGLYMYRGSAAYNNRTVYEITRPVDGSLEALFYRTRRKYCFVDLLHQQQEDGSAWMFDYLLSKTWGLGELNLIHRDQYDAILWIDTVTPPAYLPWPGVQSSGINSPLN